MPTDHDHYDDGTLRDILTRTRTIAVVGASADPRRPSFGVMGFLRRSGYTVFAVNPTLASGDIEGVTAYAALADIPGTIDMVDIFRRSDAVDAVVDDTLALDPLPSFIWMQLGVRNDAAAARAEARGVQVIMNRCPRDRVSPPRRAALISGRRRRSWAGR